VTTEWTAGLSGFGPRQRQMIFPLASVPRPGSPGLLSNGYWVSFPGVKRGRHETLNSHFHLEVKNEKELYLLSLQVPPWRVVGLLCSVLAYDFVLGSGD
jgi:hypothetical protein